MSNFLAPFFQLFMGKKLFFKLCFYIAASALKSCLIKKFKKLKKKFGRIFFGLKTGFFRASCFGLFWFQYIEGLSVAPFYSLLASELFCNQYQGPPIHLYLIFEKIKFENQVQRNGFLQVTQPVKIQFEIDKKSSSSYLIFPT